MMTAVTAQPDLKTWRCQKCGRIAAKLNLAPGSTVEVRCKCGTYNTIVIPAAATLDRRKT